MKKQNLYYIVACIILIFASLYLRGQGHNKKIGVPSLQPISGFPLEFKEYHGKECLPSYKNYHDFSADEWVLRIYTKKGKNIPISVFVGYWENQDETKKIKPPRYTNNRWGYYRIRAKSLSLGSKMITLKEFLNERGFEKELVNYCYIIDGNIISNEYHFRFLSILNSLLYGRSNAALLRVSVPVTDELSLDKAEAYEEEFMEELLSLLLKYV